MKPDELKLFINEELKKFFKFHPYSLEDELILESEIILSELLDPTDFLSIQWF